MDGKNATQELIIFFNDKIRAGEQKDMENCLSAMIELGADGRDVVATLLIPTMKLCTEHCRISGSHVNKPRKI